MANTEKLLLGSVIRKKVMDSRSLKRDNSKSCSKLTLEKRGAAFELAFKNHGEFDWWWRRLAFARFADSGDSNHDVRANTTYRVDGDDPLVEKSLHPYYKRWGINDQYDKWKLSGELVAWCYEFGRRNLFKKYVQGELNVDDSLMPLPSYPYIHDGLDMFLNAVFRRDESSPMLLASPVKSGKKWSDPMPPYQVDLEANDNSLKNKFMEFVNDQRALKSVAIKDQNKDNHNVQLSWKVIEEWDLSYNPKNGCGHYYSSNFRKKAKDVSIQLQDAILQWKQYCQTNGKDCSHEAGPQCWVQVFLIENYQTALEAYLKAWKKLKPGDKHKLFFGQSS